jgi:hypothetical protein
MADHIEAEKAKAKRMTKPEKQAVKEKKDKEEAPFATCLLNGRPEKVGSFRVEPPGLFRGRGEHPKKGCVKVGFYRDETWPRIHSRFRNEFCRRTLLSTSGKVKKLLNQGCQANGKRSFTITRSPGWLIGKRTLTGKANTYS